MTKVNIDKLTHKDLIELQQEITIALGRRRNEELADLKRKVATMVAESGFDMEDLAAGKRGGKRGPVAIKYRNPKDSTQTWTGRGRKPNWISDALKKGAKIESFLVG